MLLILNPVGPTARSHGTQTGPEGPHVLRGAHNHPPRRECIHVENVIFVREGPNVGQFLFYGIPSAHFNGVPLGPPRPNCGRSQGGRIQGVPGEDSGAVFPRPKIGRENRMLQKCATQLHSVQGLWGGIIPQGIL